LFAGDLNNMGTIAAGCPASSGQTLKSFNDWNEINLVWLADTVNNGADAQDGLTSGGVFREMAPPFLESIKQKTADIIEFIPPPRTDGSHISNAGSSLPLKFRLKDIDGNFVRDASVTLVAKKGATTVTGSFVYDLPAEQYKFVWTVPSGGTAKGVWQISYIRDFNTPQQVLLQGPEATAAGAPYSFTITVK
jgi:hypothetical protein